MIKEALVEDVAIIKDVLSDLVKQDILESTTEGRAYQAKTVPELEESNFQLVHHNKGTEAVSKASVSKSNSEVKPIRQDDAYLDFGDVRLIIDGYLSNSEQLKFSINTAKLFQMVLIEATKLMNKDDIQELSINLNLEEIAFKLGKNIERSNKKSEFKKELTNTLELLRRITIRIYREVLKGNDIAEELETAYIMTSYIVRKSGVDKDKITVNLSKQFLSYLSMGYLMPFRSSLFKIADNASYQFHTELNQYTSIGGNHAPRHKGQASPVQARLVSIDKAIEWTKTLPSLDEVKTSDRHFEKRIMQRLETILCDENGLIKNWQWCKGKGEKLTEAERNSLSEYETIKGLYIHITELRDEEQYLEYVYPATGRIIERREKKAQQKTRRTNKAKANQPKPPKDE